MVFVGAISADITKRYINNRATIDEKEYYSSCSSWSNRDPSVVAHCCSSFLP